MIRHIRQPSDYSARMLGWADWIPGANDDLLLKIAYAISEFAIAFVGPFFWICLLAGLLTAELGD